MRTISPIDYRTMPKMERDVIDEWLKVNLSDGAVCLIELYDGGGARVTRYVDDSEHVKGMERYTAELTTQPTLGDHGG